MPLDPRDGDGDGMYTATPGGKDDTPVSGATAVAEKPDDLQARLADLQERAKQDAMSEGEAEAFRRDAEQLRRDAEAGSSTVEGAQDGSEFSKAQTDFEKVDWEERGREHAQQFAPEIRESGGWSENINVWDDAVRNQSDAVGEAVDFKDVDAPNADLGYDQKQLLSAAEEDFNRGFKDVESGLLDSGKAENVFGKSVDDDYLKKLTGAPEESKVQREAGDEGLKVTFESEEHGGIEMTRTFKRDSDGPYVVNDYFRIGETGTGAGTRILNEQIDNLRDEGFARMEANCYRDDRRSYNGYYTWARLGYDADIPRSVAARLPDSLNGADRVSDLMKSPEGREFWKKEGTSFNGVFTITPERSSLSERIFDAYYAARKNRASSGA